MKNIMTIDLEEWFHANYQENVFDSSKSYEVRIINNTHRLLDLFERYHVEATFFVLGYVAEKHPELIKKIIKFGHEIASHGYAHQLVYKQPIIEFKQDIKKSIDVIENITSAKVKGYRAPSWSITEKSLWAYRVLEELGLVYDASVFPIKTFLYGIPSAPRYMYRPKVNNCEINIYEVPVSTVRAFGRNIGFSGGFYFRALPYRMIKFGIDLVNKTQNPAIVYLHPREIDIEQPRLELSKKDCFIHYYGINKCERKLIKLLTEYEFVSIKDYYSF